MRLLAIRLSALGDVIHAIPAVTLLKTAADVSWIVEAPYAELVEIVADVTAIPVRLKKFSFREIGNAWRGVRGFAVAIDFQGNIKSAAVTRASGAPVRYGFHGDAVREKPASWFYTHRVKVDQSRHVIDWNLELAAALTPNAQLPTPNWDGFAADPERKLEPFRDRIVLLPGAGRPEKLWPVERFRELVARYPDAVVGWGPGERERAEAIGGTLAPPTNLRELAFLLRAARVVVGGDTGPLHLAAALGAKCVGLYGPTDPRRNGPYGQLASTIDHFRTSRSMQTIEAPEVMMKIDEVLR
ncbi:MAG TPA: glycosyltransferase family 9 protein [Thermoanaerobaculia bacterium]|nr:glycosyltransferase family 9 protein [Thermoanaerobaculia bacterium]